MVLLPLVDPGSLASAEVIVRSPTVVLYVGPDQIMPLASMLSAIVGLALMFWRRIVSLAARCWAVVRRPRTTRPEPSVEDRA
jgi:hypothetical protein